MPEWSVLCEVSAFRFAPISCYASVLWYWHLTVYDIVGE